MSTILVPEYHSILKLILHLRYVLFPVTPLTGAGWTRVSKLRVYGCNGYEAS